MNITAEDAVRQVQEMMFGGQNALTYLKNIIKNFSEKTWPSDVRVAVAEALINYPKELQNDPNGLLIKVMAEDPTDRVRECAAVIIDTDSPDHLTILGRLLEDPVESVVKAARMTRGLAKTPPSNVA